MLKIINVLCLLVWIGWLIYGVIGTNIITLKGDLICGSVVAISFYLQAILEN